MEKIKKEDLLKNVIWKKANIDDIEEIINLYAERMKWFEKNGINQWRKYLTNHPKEQFIKAIKNGNFYILKKDNEIIAGFEISTDSNFWNDNRPNAYYLYKVVSKVGYKNIGKELFKLAKNITRENGKQYLRIECLSSNKKLNDLYDKYGFKYVREGQDYYNYTLREWKVDE